MEKIKILHLIPTLSSGGAERQLVNVVCNTSRDEFDHFVCTFSEPYFYAPMIEANGFEVRDFDLQRKRPWIAGMRKLLSFIREYNPDLINTWLYDANITGRISKWRGRLKTPIVTSLQATDYEPETIKSAGWPPTKVEVFRRIDKMTIRLTKPYFVACSQFVEDSFVKQLGIDRRKTKVIYNSVSPESLECEPNAAQEVRQELNIPLDGFVYLNLGRLDQQKNQASILRAFAEILPHIPNAYLVIVGVGGLEKVLKSLADSLEISQRVIFTGSRQDVGACLEMADVFVFPSFFEGLPLALIEALFKSLPCIVSDIEVLGEVVSDDGKGLIVNPYKIEEIAEAMLRLYDDVDLRKRLGANGFQAVENHFHAGKNAVKWEEFYRQIIDENGK